MVDSVLVQDGKAHEVWSGIAKADVRPMHPDMLAQVVEVETGTVNYGDAFADGVFTPQSVDLYAYAAARRWAKEIGGITFSGMPIPTDQRTQNILTAAFAAATADPAYTIPQWKLAAGVYAPLSNGQILAIAEAVRDHVQACFTKNQEVDDAIAAETISTPAEIDAAFEEV